LPLCNNIILFLHQRQNKMGSSRRRLSFTTWRDQYFRYSFSRARLKSTTIDLGEGTIMHYLPPSLITTPTLPFFYSTTSERTSCGNGESDEDLIEPYEEIKRS
ncbi:unnamed protein product, partial [Sphenostylis stenocarpa]